MCHLIENSPLIHSRLEYQGFVRTTRSMLSSNKHLDLKIPHIFIFLVGVTPNIINIAHKRTDYPTGSCLLEAFLFQGSSEDRCKHTHCQKMT